MASRGGSGGKGKEKGIRITKRGVRTELGRKELGCETMNKGDGRKEEELGRTDTGTLRESEPAAERKQELGFLATVEALTGLLVGQGLPKRLIGTSSGRLVIATWMVFTYVIVSAFNGNLTATLTVPTYPPRPETLAELVAVTDR